VRPVLPFPLPPYRVNPIFWPTMCRLPLHRSNLPPAILVHVHRFEKQWRRGSMYPHSGVKPPSWIFLRHWFASPGLATCVCVCVCVCMGGGGRPNSFLLTAQSEYIMKFTSVRPSTVRILKLLNGIRWNFGSNSWFSGLLRGVVWWLDTNPVDGGSMASQHVHRATTQKTRNSIFTTAKTSNLILKGVH
jgi:hypothetical protein